MRISFHYRGFSKKKIHLFALCVVPIRILFHKCDFLGYFWLMRICLMQIFPRTKSHIWQELSVLPNHLFSIGDLCKYGNVHQAKGGDRASPGTHPTVETNKHIFSI